MPRGPELRSDAELRERPPVARHLVVARIRAGLRQSDAARRVGVSAFWLCQVERGRGAPSDVLVKHLLDLYGDDE